MARTTLKGPVAGNLITKRLVARTAVASGQTNARVDQIPIDRDFVVCTVSLDALGTTAAASALITDNAGNAIVPATVVSSATPKQVLASGMNAGRRKLLRGNSLELRITTDGSGAIVAGGVVALVTGYYVEHATNNARFAESGQGKRSGPWSGAYDLITLSNLRQNANQAERVECSAKLPYGCRVEAICYSVVGHTETTGTITARVKNGTTGNFFHNAIDIDTLTNDVGRVDAISASSLIAANRTASRGDTIELHVASGASDVVPIQALTASVWVWVQGNVDLTSAVDQDLDHPGAMVGPVAGGYVVLPFINKRLANATKRVEDAHFLPVALRYVAAVFSRQSAQSTTRQIDRNGTQVSGAFGTTAFVLHNEGTALPAPGSFTGNVPATGVTAGEDTALRNWDAIQTVQFALATAGSAAYNDTASVLCAVRSHFYTDFAND